MASGRFQLPHPFREDQEWIMDEIGKMATTPSCRLPMSGMCRHSLKTHLMACSSCKSKACFSHEPWRVV